MDPLEGIGPPLAARELNAHVFGKNDQLRYAISAESKHELHSNLVSLPLRAISAFPCTIRDFRRLAIGNELFDRLNE